MERNFLEDFRRQIDQVDNEILILLKRRFQLAKKIAVYKQSVDIEIYDPTREHEIMESLKIKAQHMNLPEGFVRNLFQAIIEQSKVNQKDHMDKQAMRTKK